MTITTASRTLTAVTIEYTLRDGRARRTFEGPTAVSASRRFYNEKFKAGKNPTIVSASRG